MKIVLLAFLVVLWAVVLIPGYLRKRAEARENDSVSQFRRRLRVLQRTSPSFIEPAHRLRPERGGSSRAVIPLRYRLQTTDSNETSPISHAKTRLNQQERFARVEERRRMAVGGLTAEWAQLAKIRQRERAIRRRRQALFVLTTTLIGSLLVGALPKLHGALLLAGASFVILAVYIGILAHLARVATIRERERAAKLRYLSSARQARQTKESGPESERHIPVGARSTGGRM